MNYASIGQAFPHTDDAVRTLQFQLQALGYGTVPPSELGFIGVGGNVGGTYTTAMIREFQAANNLPISGIFDRATIDSIRAAITRITPPKTIDPLAQGVPTALSNAFPAAVAFAPDVSSRLQQEMVNASQGKAVNPSNLAAVSARLRQNVDPAAQNAANILDAIIVATAPTPPPGGGRINTTTPGGGTSPAAASTPSLLQKIGTVALLTLPAWGTFLWTKYAKN